jgi:hypothetical protein
MAIRCARLRCFSLMMAFIPCSFLFLVVLVYALVTILSQASDGIATGFMIRRLIDTSGPQRPKESLQINLSVQSGTQWHPHRYCSGTAAEKPPCWSPRASTKGRTQALDSSSQREVRAPWHPKWNNSIAICAVMRQENITDVVEWLSYYKCAKLFGCSCQSQRLKPTQYMPKHLLVAHGS